MQIDWFTFVAQIVNFLVLVWLLKRFLYQPILTTIDEREQAIADRLNSASEREANARAAQQLYETQQAELQHVKESLIAEAAQDVETWRQDRLSELRQEVAEARNDWNASVEREQQRFLSELRDRTAHQVQEVVRHVLLELADSRLEEQAIHRFVEHLSTQADKDALTTINGHAEMPVVVRSAFPISGEARSQLSAQITRSDGNPQLRFEVDPDLVCGIELVTNDHKLQWNVDSYLETLERSIHSVLVPQTHVPSRS